MDGTRSYHQSWKKIKKYTYENLFRTYIFAPITIETFGRNIKEKRGNNKNDVKSFHLDREYLKFFESYEYFE